MQTKNHSKSVKQLFMTRFSPLRTPNVSNRMNESFQKYVCARSFFRLFLERFFSCSICFVFQLKSARTQPVIRISVSGFFLSAPARTQSVERELWRERATSSRKIQAQLCKYFFFRGSTTRRSALSG